MAQAEVFHLPSGWHGPASGAESNLSDFRQWVTLSFGGFVVLLMHIVRIARDPSARW